MCVYVSIYLSIYLSIYESIYAYMLRMYVCIYAWTCVRIYGCMYVRMYVCMHLYVCMCVYMYVCMHVSPHAVRSGVRAPACVLHTAALLLWMRCAIIWSKLGARRCKRTWRLLRSRAHAAACTSPLSVIKLSSIIFFSKKKITTRISKLSIRELISSVKPKKGEEKT